MSCGYPVQTITRLGQRFSAHPYIRIPITTDVRWHLWSGQMSKLLFCYISSPILLRMWWSTRYFFFLIHCCFGIANVPPVTIMPLRILMSPDIRQPYGLDVGAPTQQTGPETLPGCKPCETLAMRGVVAAWPQSYAWSPRDIAVSLKSNMFWLCVICEHSLEVKYFPVTSSGAGMNMAVPDESHLTPNIVETPTDVIVRRGRRERSI